MGSPMPPPQVEYTRSCVGSILFLLLFFFHLHTVASTVTFKGYVQDGGWIYRSVLMLSVFSLSVTFQALITKSAAPLYKVVRSP